MRAIVLISTFLFLSGIKALSQESEPSPVINVNPSTKILSGFVRGGFYTWINKDDKNLFFPSAFSDAGLRLDIGNGSSYRAFADLRFRYGTEFQEPVKEFDIREAWASVRGKKWNLSAGQKIIKWGRADFTNPTLKLSPQNYVLRSPDREDMYMGNILVAADVYPSEKLNLEAVIVPYYRSSVLIIDPLPLPENIVINEINSLMTGREMLSYAFKADFRFKPLDWSLSWFEGYDPMPGIALSEFSLDLSQPVPSAFTQLSVTPYKTRMLGTDFEATAGSLGIRGEAAWSDPILSFESYEYVPMPELKWAAGADWSAGAWRFILEYNGKYITNFKPSEVTPVLGPGTDLSQMASLLAIPGLDPEEYVRKQVAAFNRLYNYQVEQVYHAAGLRVETEILYGKLIPSLYSMYNFTSKDLVIIPEIKIKPADGITITLGAEIYSGPKNSLFDLINDFMNGAYLSLRADF